MTITKQDILDSFKVYHADSNLTYTDMTKLEEVLQAILSINVSGDSSGDASSTNQLLQLTELEEINSKIPSLGQALASGSVPVVLTASQLSTLTPVSTVTANAGTNLNTSLL